MPDLEAYFARVDAHLATLPGPSDRVRFIEHLTDQWMHRYAAFQQRVARGAPVGGATAFDYVETIAGLDQRAARAA